MTTPKHAGPRHPADLHAAVKFNSLPLNAQRKAVLAHDVRTMAGLNQLRTEAWELAQEVA
ncbi:hypothetical protein SAMN06309944_0216 [Micrococcales bacterium KH10]|nr:hypothetical protein SAMN06309944_0216 [Micrococcales bacterium KH10]